MTFFDLSKRRAGRKDVPESDPSPASEETALQHAAPRQPPAPVGEDPATWAANETRVAPPQRPWDEQLQRRTLDALKRGADVLVVGLGPWEVTWPQALFGRARGVIAIDPDRARLGAVAGYCQRTIEASLDDPNWPAKLGDQRFGIVLVTDALLHVADPVALLRRLRPFVAPDGQLVAVVPNAAHVDARLGLMTGDAPRDFDPGGVRHHYTRQRLRELFAFSGFRIEEGQVFRRAPFDPASKLVPDLFPRAVLQALGSNQELDAAYFILMARPATAESLLRALFDEQENLRKATRNELARLSRGAHGLVERLKDADVRHEAIAKELDESRRAAKQQAQELEEARRLAKAADDAFQRAAQNLTRLSQELDVTRREMRGVRESFAYKVLNMFKGKDKPKGE